jgi:surface polysaccharide O-acyltransferase-like enzyme
MKHTAVATTKAPPTVAILPFVSIQCCAFRLISDLLIYFMQNAQFELKNNRGSVQIQIPLSPTLMMIHLIK